MNMVRWLRDFPHRYQRVTGSKTYIPQLDGLRFIAIFQVVLFHAMFRGERVMVPAAALQTGAYAYLPHGQAGVELFFLISGYIISYPFVTGPGPSLKSFYLRRLYRLEPPYFIVLIACFLLLTVAGSHLGKAPAFEKSSVPLPLSFLASCFYMHGLLFQAPPRLNPPLWSLELEIQFYLLAPFLLRALRQMSGFRTRCVVLAVMIAAAMVVQVLLPRAEPRAAFTILANGYAFLIGVLLCEISAATRDTEAPGAPAYDAVFLVGLFVFVASASLWVPMRGNPSLGLANMVLRAIGIVCLYLGTMRGLVARALLSNAWLCLLGGACYSIYLVHVPLMQPTANILFAIVRPHNAMTAFGIAMLVLVPMSFAAGLAYYVAVERPFMRKDWPQRVARRLRGATS